MNCKRDRRIRPSEHQGADAGKVWASFAFTRSARPYLQRSRAQAKIGRDRLATQHPGEATMSNPAETQVPVHELIRERWSPIAFSDRRLEREQIVSLLEAARWAPSSFNGQPWSYLIATKDEPEEFERLASCLVEGNSWAKQAPLLLLAIAATNFTHNGKPNNHAFHDVGLANENLVLQATSLGLFVHQMAGFLPDKARELFAIPEDQVPLTMIAVGYHGQAGDLSEALQKREQAARSRKPLKELVFTGRWGQISLLVK
jgi:nitroreductase